MRAGSSSGGGAGLTFVVLFVVGVLLLGDLVGAFADPDRVFEEHFADGDNRAKDLAGAYLLVFAGVAFSWFARTLQGGAGHGPLEITGVLVAGGMIVAAAAFATVPLSQGFGSLVDDPGLHDGEAVLAQFAYSVLSLGAMLPLAAFIVLVSRRPDLVPRWLSIAGYPVAVLVALTSWLFMPLVLVPVWVAAVVVTRRRTAPA